MSHFYGILIIKIPTDSVTVGTKLILFLINNQILGFKLIFVMSDFINLDLQFHTQYGNITIIHSSLIHFIVCNDFTFVI